MTEMMEKAKAALQREWDGHETLPPLTFMDREVRGLVIAVLKAIREPSEEMLQATHAAYGKAYTDVCTTTWRLWIDTITGDPS